MGNHEELMRKKGKYFTMITQEHTLSDNQCDNEDEDEDKDQVYDRRIIKAERC